MAQTASGLAVRRRWVDLVPDLALSRTEMLVRLVVLNTALLVEATASRRCLHLPYEESVLSPGRSQARLKAFLPSVADGLPAAAPQKEPQRVVVMRDATYSTHESRTSLSVSLDRGEVTQIEIILTKILDLLRPVVTPEHHDTVRDLLSGTAHGRYTPKPSSVTPHRPKVGKEIDRPVHTAFPPPQFVPVPGPASRASAITWRNQLVTNREYCAFLNALRSRGTAKVVGGVHLLFNESMIPERGGRIVYDEHAAAHRVDAAEGAYRVVPGYDAHAVSWVTWLGAALFARHAGARLPRRAEFLNLLRHIPRRSHRWNVNFRYGDTVPVLEDDLDAERVHHVRGNVQVWCEDGPPDGPVPSMVTRRFFSGAAWNTPGDDADVTRPKSRHITGSSRSIGVRLVRSTTDPMTPLPIDTITQRLNSGLAMIGTSGRDLRERDEALARLVYEVTP